jgi:hypothetical protein
VVQNRITLDKELVCCERLMKTLAAEAKNSVMKSGKKEEVKKSGRSTTFELSEISERKPERKRKVFCPDTS